MPITDTVSEVRAKLQNGQMRGVRFRVLFRAAGSTRAIVEIMGVKFTIDDSSRLVKQAQMTQVGGRAPSQLPGAHTTREVQTALNALPQLTAADFALRVTERISRVVDVEALTTVQSMQGSAFAASLGAFTVPGRVSRLCFVHAAPGRQLGRLHRIGGTTGGYPSRAAMGPKVPALGTRQLVGVQ